MAVARIRRAVEAGTLDPAAKEIALCMAGGREKVFAEFLGGGIWEVIADLMDMTIERREELVRNTEAYLKTCDLLGLGLDWTQPATCRLGMLRHLKEEE